MSTRNENKVIFVEGSSDKKKVQSLLKHPVEIICTNGTISVSKLDEIAERYFEHDVYILFDSDESGEKLRRQFKREFPLAEHLYVDRSYREVAATPKFHLVSVLLNANFDVRTD